MIPITEADVPYGVILEISVGDLKSNQACIDELIKEVAMLRRQLADRDAILYEINRLSNNAFCGSIPEYELDDMPF